ncbi:winged helix-turn-helix transcriptional regulator [Lentzea sp. NPDC051213]|uniref:winged helix-turn-helix transcriptional regulator n=1 Tax=Lentzea sp. NPDC051213 TaxID=3364126 RepID=UPI0037AA9E22
MRVYSDEPACSIERSVGILGERWSLLIIREIFRGHHRFSEIREALGIAPNLLSARLKSLIDADVIDTRTYQEAGSRPRDSYHLTAAGKNLLIVLAAFQQWGDSNLPRPSGPSALRRTRHGDRPVRVAFLDDAGNEVPVSEVVFAAPE